MNPRAISAIVRKDLVAFSRDRFFVLITFLALIAYAVVFWLLPSDVDETFTLGVADRDGAAVAALQPIGIGLEVTAFEDRDALVEAVDDGDVGAGLVFPDGFADDLAAGDAAAAEVLITAGLPEEFRHLAAGLVDQVAFALTGTEPAVSPIGGITVLGEDRAGDQVSLQEEMRPLFAFFVLMVETLALASLVAAEIQNRTVTAVLITPATARDFLAAKGLLGTSLAFGEAVLLMALIRGFSREPAVLLVALLLGAILVTGLGMVAGSFGKDFIGVLFWSVAFMLPLLVPAFAVLFPGSESWWVTLLPSWGLVDAIVGITTEGASWSGVAPSLLLLAAWGAACFTAGSIVLRRRVATL